MTEVDLKLNKIIKDFYAYNRRYTLGEIDGWTWHGMPTPLGDSSPKCPPKLGWPILKAIDFAHPMDCESSESDYVRFCKRYLHQVKQDKLDHLLPWRLSLKWRKRALTWYEKKGFNYLEQDVLWEHLYQSTTSRRLTASYWAAMEPPLEIKQP